MYAILHIPTGTYLLYYPHGRLKEENKPYYSENKQDVESCLLSYFKNEHINLYLSLFIEGTTNEFTTTLSEFEIVEINNNEKGENNG
jgi:hypothetical protein